MCGFDTYRRGRFFAAFPYRDGDIAAFPLSDDPPPVASWRMTECRRCGVVTPLPYPTVDEINSFYSSQMTPNEWEVKHYVRLDLNDKAIAGTRRLAEQLTTLHDGPGRLLEVGCAAGWILRAAEELGWIVKGVEGAPKFSAFARDVLGLDVYPGLISEIDCSTWPVFDVIIAFDVFEHLHDPVQDLKVLRKLAAPNASLLVTTPNISSLVAKVYGRRWRQVLPSHVNYSTPTSMAFALERAGWRLERISEPRYWDPNLEREASQKRIEFAKFVARMILHHTVMHLALQSAFVRELPAKVTSGRLTWESLQYRVGDQPVLGDVMFVIARPV